MTLKEPTGTLEVLADWCVVVCLTHEEKDHGKVLNTEIDHPTHSGADNLNDRPPA